QRVRTCERFVDPRGLRGEVAELRLERDAQRPVRQAQGRRGALEFARDGFGVGVAREKNRDGTARGILQRGDGRGGRGEEARALLKRRVDARVERDVVGAVAPRGVGGDQGRAGSPLPAVVRQRRGAESAPYGQAATFGEIFRRRER